MLGGDPAQLVAAGSEARRLLGWEPRRSAIEDILTDAWAFHRRRPGGYGGPVEESERAG